MNTRTPSRDISKTGQRHLATQKSGFLDKGCTNRDKRYTIQKRWPRSIMSQKGERRGEELREGSMRGGKRRPLINDRWGNRNETVGSGRGHLGRDGEKGTRPIDLPGPEISAKLPRTPSTHRNSHISTTVERVGTKRVSPGSHKKVVPPCQKARGPTRKCRLGDARLQVASDSARNCMSYGQSEVGARRAASRDGDAQGESGERGIGEKRAPVPEISAKPSHTPLYTEKTHISTMNERVLKKKVSPGIHKPVEPPRPKQGRRWEDGIASVGNRQAEFYETSGGDRGAQGELGERGNRENGAPNPEIFAKQCDTACLPKNCDIFACAGAIATKSIPFESLREGQMSGRRDIKLARWGMTRDPNGLQQPSIDSLEPVRGPRLTPEYYEMTKSRRRQRLLSSRLAGWWAGLEWAHPSNLPSRESGLRGLLEYKYERRLLRSQEQEGGSGLCCLLEYEYKCGSLRSREQEGGRPRESNKKQNKYVQQGSKEFLSNICDLDYMLKKALKVF
ncbi:hypothetical protein EDD16DRAFT_1733427 [Pisolithus croceorrhizus]|nr:hypothetical protein EDD16DRAFT_1733427 [Pisolithus croceorrhizus]